MLRDESLHTMDPRVQSMMSGRARTCSQIRKTEKRATRIGFVNQFFKVFIEYLSVKKETQVTKMNVASQSWIWLSYADGDFDSGSGVEGSTIGIPKENFAEKKRGGFQNHHAIFPRP